MLDSNNLSICLESLYLEVRVLVRVPYSSPLLVSTFCLEVMVFAQDVPLRWDLLIYTTTPNLGLFSPRKFLEKNSLNWLKYVITLLDSQTKFAERIKELLTSQSFSRFIHTPVPILPSSIFPVSLVFPSLDKIKTSKRSQKKCVIAMSVTQELSFSVLYLPTLIWPPLMVYKWQDKLTQKVSEQSVSWLKLISWTEELTPSVWFLTKKSNSEWVMSVSRTELRKISSTRSLLPKLLRRKRCISAPTLSTQACHLVLLVAMSLFRNLQVSCLLTSSTPFPPLLMRSEKNLDPMRKTWKNLDLLFHKTTPKKCSLSGLWSLNSLDLTKTRSRVSSMPELRPSKTTSVVLRNRTSKVEQRSSGSSTNSTLTLRPLMLHKNTQIWWLKRLLSTSKVLTFQVSLPSTCSSIFWLLNSRNLENPPWILSKMCMQTLSSWLIKSSTKSSCDSQLSSPRSLISSTWLSKKNATIAVRS